MPYMKRKDFIKWRNRIEEMIDELYGYTYEYITFDDNPYRLGYVGAKHTIALYFKDHVMATHIKGIEEALEKIRLKIRRGEKI